MTTTLITAGTVNCAPDSLFSNRTGHQQENLNTADELVYANITGICLQNIWHAVLPGSLKATTFYVAEDELSETSNRYKGLRWVDPESLDVVFADARMSDISGFKAKNFSKVIDQT